MVADHAADRATAALRALRYRLPKPALVQALLVQLSGAHRDVGGKVMIRRPRTIAPSATATFWYAAPRRVPWCGATATVWGLPMVKLAACVTLLGCASSDQAATSAGTIEYTETDVASTVSARVLRVLVDEGQPVQQGDTLVVLSQSPLAAELETRSDIVRCWRVAVCRHRRAKRSMPLRS